MEVENENQLGIEKEHIIEDNGREANVISVVGQEELAQRGEEYIDNTETSDNIEVDLLPEKAN